MLHPPETDLKKTRCYQEVFHEGELVGEARGEARGELSMVLRLLRRRLGGLDGARREQIARLASTKLGELGEALLDFTRVEDLDAWLRGHAGGD